MPAWSIAAALRRRLCRWAWLTAVLATAGGCQSTTEVELRQEVARLEGALAACESEAATRDATIAGLHRQLADARGLTAADLEFIYYPEKIRFASLTGGADYDDAPGDDGITAYLQPIDRDGHVVKVAGAIRIELFDLALAPQQTLIGRYDFSPADARERWYGSLWTQHYTLKCPWRDGPPQHAEITVRATFTDYLTQRVMTAQTVCRIELPSAAQ